MSRALSLLALSLVLSDRALAAKDWNLVEDRDPILQNDVCRATTTVSTATTPAELTASFPKDRSQLPIVYVKITGLTTHPTHGMIRLSTKEFHPLFLLKAAATPAEPDIFWYAPVDLPGLVERIKSASTMDVAFDEKSTTPIPVRFSLKGSANAIDAAAKCLKVKDLLPEEFLKTLNLKGEFGLYLPPTISGEALQAITQKAYKDYLDGVTASTALADLRKAMKPLTDKEAAAIKELQPKQAKLDKTTSSLNDNLASKAAAEQQLAEMNATLAKAQTDKAAADKDFAAKKAIYDPARAQLQPFMTTVDERKDDLQSAKDSLASTKQDIADAESELARLQNRVPQLQNEIASLDSSISSKQSELSNKQNELNRYNVQWETQRILDSDWNYQRMKQDKPRKENDLRQLQWQVRQAEQDSRQAEQALRQCQQTAGADCSQQQNAVNQARMQCDNLRRQQNQLENDVRNIERQMQWAEMEAQRRAEQGRRDLEQAVSNAYNELNNLRSSKMNSENELSSIRGVQIPNKRSEISSLKAALPSLENSRVDAQNRLDAAVAALNAEKARIGFDAIEKNYVDAKNLVAKLDRLIGDTQSSIAKTTKTISALAATIAKLQADVQTQTADRDASQAKLTAIQQQLVAQRAQEAALQAQLDAAKTALADDRGQYQAMYDKLTEGI